MQVYWAGRSDPQRNKLMERWASEIIWPGKNRDFGNCVTMGIIHRDELIGVIVWHNWDPDNRVIEFSGAAKSSRWLTKQTLREMFDYPFIKAGCRMAVARVSEHNEPLLRQLKSYGFDIYRIPLLRGEDEDEMICTLTKEQWASNKFNRPKSC